MTTQTTNILILGGGYAGVMAALRLAHRTRRLNRTITLINASETFVERCRLHEAATGTELRNRPLAQMLRGTNVQLCQGWVTALEPAEQRVTVRTDRGEERFPYDYLINALGSRVNHANVPGVADYAYTLDTDGTLAADALHQKLASFGAQPFRVIVVGGGATGIETATQVKAIYPYSDVQLITQGEFGAFKTERVRQHFQTAFAEQQVTVHEHARVVAVEDDGVLLETGKIGADVVIWSGGFVAAPLARAAGVEVNERNQILVDPYLRSLTYPTLYAAGDAAQPVEEPGAPYRMSLFTALTGGAQAAENIAAVLYHKEQQPFSFVWYGQGIALGPNDAVGFPTYPADQAWPLIFRRKLAVRVRNFFVWYLMTALEWERRFPGSFYWGGKRRYGQQQRRQQQVQSTAGV
ncbi:MAG: FAD-dependent oxidoreductase [Caldilineaceae bacterium]|nr:FAD-dependent oxidoreductase [Caldilineaceae bacterium]